VGTVRLSTKGQLVIPREVRERHGWKAGTVLAVEDLGDVVVLRVALEVQATTVDDLLGLVPHDGRARSLEEMEDAIARGAEESR